MRDLWLHGNQITDIYPLVENSGLGYGDWMWLEFSDLTNPLSLEAIEVHIPILLSRYFEFFYYPEEPNLNAACYPSPERHAEDIAYNIVLTWNGYEEVEYEVFLGTSSTELYSIGFGDLLEENTFSITPELLPDTEYFWRVKSTTEDEELWSGMWHFITGNYVNSFEETTDIPDKTMLHKAYPNPFNPTTTIKFSVKKNETANLQIYNLKGQIVKSYPVFYTGNHLAEWKGKDNEGNKVSSGVYLYKLKSKSSVKVRKMLLLK